MRAILFNAALAGLAFAAAPPAAASDDFQARLDRAVERSMIRHTPAALERGNAGGIATLRFSAGPDGRAGGIALVRSSGDISIDRAALRAIAGLELPADTPAGPHLAVLHYGSEASFADRSVDARELRAATGEARLALRALERERLARGGGSPVTSVTLD